MSVQVLQYNVIALSLAVKALLGALTLILGVQFVMAGERIVVTDPAKADADYRVQGEYSGDVTVEGEKHKVGVQVWACGGGAFEAVGYQGGLPGDGWDGNARIRVPGKTEGGVTTFTGPVASGKIKDGVLTVAGPDGKVFGELKRVERKSETLGAKPPAGAIVLFDGTTAEKFENGLLTDDKLLAWKPGTNGVTSLKKFQDCKVHLEFMTPYMPRAKGQDRGNSGCYLQARYEVQVLDSFGLDEADNECGGIYSVGKPLLNMCFPPLAWQTYDIEFKAARYDAAGKRTQPARLTVKHNGVLIHKDQEIQKLESTTAAPKTAGPSPEGIYLQNHGCPVFYRNIWAIED